MKVYKPNPNKLKAQQIAASLQNSEKTPAKILTNCEGHVLSVKNSLLALAQNPNASVLGGFDQWKRVNRQVKKGEKAIFIYAVSFKGEGENKTQTFRLVPVFDILQTEELKTDELNTQTIEDITFS